jgi:hypothetical protein
MDQLHQTWHAVAALLLAIVLVSFKTDVSAEEQGLLSLITVGLQNGMVTAVQERSVEIDSRNYPVKETALIVNDQGTPIEFSSVAVNSEVKFHLKEGQIDKMVVSLPR